MEAYLGVATVSCFAIAGLLASRLIFTGAGTSAAGTPTSKPVRKKVKIPQLPSPDARLDLDQVDEEALGYAADSVTSRNGAALKRIFDIVISLAMLTFLAPMLIFTMLAIRLDSKGPVVYRQKRVGMHGRVFEVYKFRSMIVDAERNGAQYASVGDNRITKVGHIIRHLRIDEIPQAVNVLRGEMSFVGPRPERPEFVETLEREIPHYQVRHLVKPGITGWAQVKYEYAASVEGAREKLRYDLFYIGNYSLFLDCAIVALTVRVALFGLGSR